MRLGEADGQDAQHRQQEHPAYQYRGRQHQQGWQGSSHGYSRMGSSSAQDGAPAAR
ncbi:Uncharacterised protein [Bordetella pertussis]|nr:Uncharacterised protein [Bordetella pertussis]